MKTNITLTTIALLQLAGFIWFGLESGWRSTLGLLLIMGTNNITLAALILSCWRNIILMAAKEDSSPR